MGGRVGEPLTLTIQIKEESPMRHLPPFRLTLLLLLGAMTSRCFCERYDDDYDSITGPTVSVQVEAPTTLG